MYMLQDILIAKYNFLLVNISKILRIPWLNC